MLEKFDKENILKAEAEYWDNIARQKGHLEDHAISISSYMALQDLIWRKVHSLAFDLCGSDLYGKRVLDLGCGKGIGTVILAEKGANLTALDLSSEMVKLTLQRAKNANVEDQVIGVVGDVSALKFVKEPFDLIYAGAVLHHIPDFQFVISFLADVTRDGGHLVAYDPFSSSFFDFARNFIPYKGKHRSKNERSLNSHDYEKILEFFGDLKLYPFGLFTAIERYFLTNSEKIWKNLERLDRICSIIFGNTFCWHMVCKATKVRR